VKAEIGHGWRLSINIEYKNQFVLCTNCYNPIEKLPDDLKEEEKGNQKNGQLRKETNCMTYWKY